MNEEMWTFCPTADGYANKQSEGGTHKRPQIWVGEDVAVVGDGEGIAMNAQLAERTEWWPKTHTHTHTHTHRATQIRS